MSCTNPKQNIWGRLAAVTIPANDAILVDPTGIPEWSAIEVTGALETLVLKDKKGKMYCYYIFSDSFYPFRIIDLSLQSTYLIMKE